MAIIIVESAIIARFSDNFKFTGKLYIKKTPAKAGVFIAIKAKLTSIYIRKKRSIQLLMCQCLLVKQQCLNL